MEGIKGLKNMGIQDRDYMKRDSQSYRVGDGSVHPALRNLKFAKYGYTLVEKALVVLILGVLVLTVLQSHLTCANINIAYDANKDGVITYKDIGFFVNQLFYQPLLWLQKRNELNGFFTFLNIFKNNCLSLESILFSAIVWLASSVILIKAILYARYALKFLVHGLLFDVVKINPFSTINKTIFKFLYPVKAFRFNTIFILILFFGLAIVQIKLMLTSEPEVVKGKANKTEKVVSIKKNKQTDLVEGSKNYTNIYLNNINELKKLDARIENITSDDTKNIYTLSKALTEGLTTDLEKTYVIYKWVTNNIAYDTESFFANNMRGIGNANTVLQRRKAVCDGYAELIMRLGLQSGLLVNKIEGYAKGYGYKIGDAMSIPNHAWDTVKIDGKWYLLDATWDAGYTNETTHRYDKKTTGYDFFLTNPQIFIYSHFPKDDKWQLTNLSWDKAEFFNTVNVTETAFKLGLNIEKQRQAIINAESLPYALDFDSGVTMQGTLIANNSEIKGQWTLQKYDANGNAKLLVSAPKNGVYTLQLYGAVQKNVNYLSSIMQYKINVNNTINNFSSFPQTFPPYKNSKAILEFPLNGVLSSNQITRFKIKVNGAKKLVIYQNQQPIDTMKEEDGYFTAELKLEKGELVINGDFNTPNQLDAVLKYQVN